MAEHRPYYRLRVQCSIASRADEAQAFWGGQSAGRLKTKQGLVGAMTLEIQMMPSKDHAQWSTRRAPKAGSGHQREAL